MVMPERRPGMSLAGLRDAFIAAPGTSGLIDRLADPDTLVVTTGQQAGLFTGPLYTIHKALSAAALAAELSSRWGQPVRPVFWVAGDDHDFAEAASAAWLDSDGQVVEASLPGRPPDAPMLPMYREPLGPGVEAALAALLRSLPATPFAAGVREWLTRHYTPAATIAGAYGGAMAELLAPLGIVCLDSTHPVFKRAAAPILLRAVHASAKLDRLLVEETARFIAAGEAAPVVVGEDATLVFIEDRLGRDRLVRDGDQFHARRSGSQYPMRELERVAEREPGRLSPNVLLRPVVESALLPTVAYVGGPGELRYLRMTPPVYAELGVHRQTPVPRWSGVVVEPFVDRILGKFAGTIEELGTPGGMIERRVLRADLPSEVVDALARLEAESNRLYDQLTPGAVAVDPTLERPVASARRQALWAVRDLERRILSRLRARHSVELGQLQRARAAILPVGKPQERALTVAPFLARHGPGFLDAVRQAAAASYATALEDPAPRP